MRYKQLGRTGMFVSELCLGTATFGSAGEDGSWWKEVAGLDQRTSTAMVERALSAGINFIDTADCYSYGQAEKHVGHALRALGVRRQDVIISTKVYEPMSNNPNDRGASRGHILDGVRASLDRLKIDYIDLYLIHGDDSVTPIEEMLRALDDLVRMGLVRYIGISNWQAWRIAKALGVSERLGLSRFDALEAYYSIAGRDIEREIVPLIESEGLALMIWSPLAGGLLSGKFGPGAPENQSGRRAIYNFPPVNEERAWRCVATMREVAEKHGSNVATVALAWLLAQPFVTSVIVGAKRFEQLNQNIASTSLKLDADDLAKLDEVSVLPSEYPGWMLEQQRFARVPQLFAASGGPGDRLWEQATEGLKMPVKSV